MTYGRSGLASALAMLTLGCANVDPSAEDRFARTGELIALSGAEAQAANACFTCHGLDGRGDGAGAPRLAGLDVGYIERQLGAYADGRRHHPRMAWIAGRLSEADRLAVASYYAQMPYTPADRTETGPAPALYVRGDPARGLQACAICHGLAGEGAGAANPALGGQPAPYLADQLHQWRQSRRRNDPGNVMLQISQRLTDSEIESLAIYSARLPGVPLRPESPAASRSERRADPRNDASAPLPRAVAR